MAIETEEQKEQALRQAQDILWAIQGVLLLRKEKVTPMSGPDAGKRIKVKIDSIEKLVRIRACMLSLENADLLEAVEFEAKNRIMLSNVTGRKPWE